MLKSMFLKLKSKKFLFILVALILVVVLLLRGNGKNGQDEFTVKRTDFVKSVSVSGKVVSVKNVDLGFDTSGIVSQVYKDVGDKVYQGEVIVALDSSELQASRDKARANLLAEEAELNKLKSDGEDTTEVSNNKRLVVNKILDAYTKSDNAIRNKVDQFYENGRNLGPEIKYTFANYFDTKDSLNDGRQEVESVLKKWQKELSTLTADTYDKSFLDKSFVNLLLVKKFLDAVSFAVNSFKETDDLTLTMIEKYKNDIANARKDINDVTADLTSISDDLRSSVSEIPIAEANVESAKAEIRSIDAQIAKTVIRAPFSGIISAQNAKVGESVGSNTEMVSIITDEVEIEAYVPEVNITGVAIQNKVFISLDADPSLTNLTGLISHIDPAETEKDGVSNYKIKVIPDKSDAVLKSGMTTDLRIETERRTNVLTVPRKFISNGSSKVIVKKDKKVFEDREVQLGEIDSQGNIEILSGLSEDEVIVLPEVVKQ